MESLEFVNSLKDTLITYTCERGTFDTTIQHAYTKEMEQLETGLQELAQYRALAEQIGCPLEVYAQLKYDTHIFDQDGVKWFLEAISKDNYITTIRIVRGEEKAESLYKQFKLSDYKKTFWLKQDRSE